MDSKQLDPLQAEKLTERLQPVIGELKLYTSDGRTGRGKRWEGGREGKKERWRFLIYLLLPATSWINQLRG